MANGTATPSEVVARSYIEDPSKVSPDKQKAQKRANEIRTNLAKGRNPGEVLKIDLEHEVSDKKGALEKRFGVTQVPPPDTDIDAYGRMEQAMAALNRTDALTRDKGFESLTTANQEIVIKAIIDNVVSRSEAFSSFDENDKREFAKSMANMAEFRNKLSEILNTGVVGGTELQQQQEEKVRESALAATRELQEAQDKLKEHDEQLRDLEEKKQQAERISREFALPAGRATHGGARYERMNDLWLNIQTSKPFADSAANYIHSLGRRQQQNQPVATFTPESAKQTLEAYNQIVQQYNLLQTEKTNNEQNLNKLTDQITRSKIEKIGLEAQVRQKTELGKLAMEKKTTQEKKVIADMEFLIARAAALAMKEEADARAEEHDKLQKKKAEEATNEDERKIAEAVRVRWQTVEQRWGRTITNINKEQITDDFHQMLVDSGPEGVIRDMMLEGVWDREERERIEEKLKTDKSFMDKQKMEVAKILLRKKLEISRVDEQEVRLLIEKISPDVVNEAIGSRGDIVATIDAIVQNANKDLSYFERVKRVSGHNLLKMLVLLFAGMHPATRGIMLKNMRAEELGVRQELVPNRVAA